MMTYEEVKGLLKQRFPMVMVDRVLELEPGKRIKAVKCVSGNEIFFLGHFPDYSIMPGILIIESFAQSASILFSGSTGKGMDSGEMMVIGAVNDMRFLAPVVPGYSLIIEVNVIKMFEDAAMVEGTVTMEDTVVAKGKMTFARKKV